MEKHIQKQKSVTGHQASSWSVLKTTFDGAAEELNFFGFVSDQRGQNDGVHEIERLTG